jgi:hypothetical protein
VPTLRLKTGEQVHVPAGLVQEALASGLYEPPVDATVPLVTAQGTVGEASLSDVGRLQKMAPSTLRPETGAEQAGRSEANREERVFGGVGGAAAAIGAGAARGLSLGLSDLALTKLGVAPEELAALRRVQSKLSLASEIAGGAAPALLSGGSGALAAAARATPAGLVSSGGRAVAGLGAGAGLAGRVGAGVAAGAAEGAAFGAGQAVSDALIHDKPLTADAFRASVGPGALFGAAFGGAAVGGIAAAQKLRPKLDDVLRPGRTAAAETSVQELRTAGDVAVEVAERTALSPAEPMATRAVLGAKLERVQEAAKALDAVGDDAAAVRLAQDGPPPKQDTKTIHQSMVDDVDANLFQDQKDAIRRFHDNMEFDELNSKLRGKEVRDVNNPGKKTSELNEDDRQLVSTLDDAIELFPAPNDTMLYRGIRRGADLPQNVGDDVIDPAYMFASLDDSYAKDFAKAEGFFMQIEAPAGTPMLALKGRQQGVMLPRAAPLKVVSIDPTNRIVRARYMVPGAANDIAPSPTGAAAAPVGDPVSDYHAAVSDLADSLAKAGRPVRVPENPVATTAPDAGTVARLEEVVPDPGAQARLQLRNEVQEAIDRMDSTATPMIQEANAIAAAQEPLALAGKTMADLVADASGAAKLAKLTTAAAAAQAEVQRVFGVGEASARTVEQLLSSQPADLGRALRKLHSYDSAMSRLAEQLDQMSPSVTGVPRADMLAQAKTPLHAQAPAPLSKGWDAGDLLAVADVMGLDIEDLPIIGKIPGLDVVLKARLAYRRLGSVKVRLAGAAGKVGAIAARAQAVRNEIGKAVTGFIESGGRAIRAAAIPTTTKVLGELSFGPEPPPKGETATEAFHRLSDELQRAADDGSTIRSKIQEGLDLEIPELVDPIVDGAVGMVQYLARIIPKDPRPSAIIKMPWDPDRVELHNFAQAAWAASAPAAAVTAIMAGTAGVPAAEAVREVYPALFVELQRELVNQAAATKKTFSLAQRSAISTLLGVPLTAFESPEFAAAMQQSYQKSTPGPEPTGNVRMQGLDQMQVVPAPADMSGFSPTQR